MHGTSLIVESHEMHALLKMSPVISAILTIRKNKIYGNLRYKIDHSLDFQPHIYK